MWRRGGHGEDRLGRCFSRGDHPVQANFSLDIEATAGSWTALIRDGVSGPDRLRHGRREHVADAAPRRSPSWKRQRTSRAAACRLSPASPSSRPLSPSRSRRKPSGSASTASWSCRPWSIPRSRMRPPPISAASRRPTDLPIMVYNNPPIYKNDVTPDILASLADCETVVCFKDSSGDTRRFTDTQQHGRRPLRALRRPRRRGGRERDAGRCRLGLRHVERVSAGGRDAVPPGEGRALRGGDARSTSGSCRCCTSTPARISCNASSFASRSWGAGPS